MRLTRYFAIVLMLFPYLYMHSQGQRFQSVAMTTGYINGTAVLKPVQTGYVSICLVSGSACNVATIYSDQALTTPTSNPIILDSTGNFGFWAAPGTYKYAICSSPSTCHTYDAVLATQGEPGTPLHFAGIWTNTATYSNGDLISYNNSLYISLADSNSGHIPLSSPSYWTVYNQPVISITDYGAKCDGVTDDSAAISSASFAAGAIYAATGAPSTIQITKGITGVCLITNTISYYSGSHFFGSGGIIVNNTASTPSFNNATTYADGVDDVEFNHVTIHQTTAGSLWGIAYNGGQGSAGSPGGVHHHFAVRNSIIIGSGYGIAINVYNQDDGISHHLEDVQITGNTVGCALISGSFDTACRDGIHISGDVSNFHMDGNTVYNRADAALALTSTGGTNPSGFPGILARLTPTDGTISNNVCTDDAAGVDISGGNLVQVVGNTCDSHIPSTNSTPGLRFIFDQYPTPSHIDVIGGRYANDATGSDRATVKFDFAGTSTGGHYPACFCTVSDAVFASNSGSNALVYFNANGVTFKNNTIETNADLAFTSDNPGFLENVLLAGNRWKGTRSFSAPASNIAFSNVWMVNDITSDGVSATFPVVGTLYTSSVNSAPSPKNCGLAFTGTTTIQDCISTSITYNGPPFANPPIGVNTTHVGSTGGATYTWDGIGSFGLGGQPTKIVCWKADGKTLGYATMSGGDISACN